MSDNSDTNQLATQLSAFGLNKIEAAIYLHLVNKQPRTILEVAKELNLPRTSVYDNALKLSDRGLVEKVVTFKSRKLRASPPNVLRDFIDQEKKRVELLESQLKELETKVTQLAPALTNTEVRYYNGKAGFKQMLWNVLRCKEVIGYSQLGRAEVVGLPFILKLQQEAIRRGITDRVIVNPTPATLNSLTNDPTSLGRKVFQETRFLPVDKLYITGDTSIYNNVFAVTYWKQGEVVGVEIENAELVKTQKSIFELLWQIAEPIDKPVV